jgi:hypothetical protein
VWLDNITALQIKAEKERAIYGGRAKNIARKNDTLRRKGFRGTMYYAYTRNMTGSEIKLWKSGFTQWS